MFKWVTLTKFKCSSILC